MLKNTDALLETLRVYPDTPEGCACGIRTPRKDKTDAEAKEKNALLHPGLREIFRDIARYYCPDYKGGRPRPEPAPFTCDAGKLSTARSSGMGTKEYESQMNS